MNERTRLMTMVGVMLALLLVTSAWSYGRWTTARDRAARAASDSQAVAALAEAIESLRREPTMGVQELGDTQLNAMLARAMRTAGLDPDRAIQSIRHQPDRRVANTPYRQVIAELRLQGLTLRQLTQFLHALTGENAGLRVDVLQLSSRQGEGVGATWTIDPLSLSYLIYAPEEPGPRRAAAAR